MPSRWEARDRKLERRRRGMVVSNRSLISTILPVIAKRAREAEERLKVKEPKEGTDGKA